MAVVAVGVELDQDGAFALAALVGGAAHGVEAGQQVHAVDDLGVEVVVGEAGGAARHLADAGDLAVGAAGHAVVVVDQGIDDREAEAVLAGVVGIGELAHGGPVERLHHHAVVVGAVAGEAAGDLAVAEVARAHGGAGGDRHAAADDGVGAEVTDAEVGDVHAAAAALAVAVLLAEELGDGAVDMVFEPGLDELLALLARLPGEARAEFRDAHAADGRATLGQRIAVAAVGRGDVVVVAHAGAAADRRGLLADRDVGGPAVVVAGAGGIGARAQLDDHLLEFADRQHVFEKIDGLLRGQIPPGDFGLEILLVGIGGDFAAVDRLRFEHGLKRAEVIRVAHGVPCWLKG